jgi:hypothetical protein
MTNFYFIAYSPSKTANNMPEAIDKYKNTSGFLLPK